MTIQEQLDKIKSIQAALLVYLENENQGKCEKLLKLLEDTKIREDRHNFKSFLYLIQIISNYHHRLPNLFDKVEQILLLFKSEILKYFTNNEIFKIFCKNKKLLLFLIEEKIIIVDQEITDTIISRKFKYLGYRQFFYPEIKPFINKRIGVSFDDFFDDKYTEQSENVQLPENFYENRKKGEMDGQIFEIIRNDSIDEFIVYINKYNYKIDDRFKVSFYETISFLVDEYWISIIDYALIYGAIQIVKYLLLNHISFDKNSWICAIHGNNPEIINLLEEKKIESTNYKKILTEAIKCHHNDMARYIKDNYLSDNNLSEDDREYDRDPVYNTKVEFNFLAKCLHFNNFELIDVDSINESCFYYLCKYGYYHLVKILLNTQKISINEVEIFNYHYFSYLIQN